MAPKPKYQSALSGDRIALRTLSRAGQDAPDVVFHKESRKLSKMARKDLLLGYNITHAEYDEPESLAIQWLLSYNAHECDFTSVETYDIR
jgi:hypothetical protein